MSANPIPLPTDDSALQTGSIPVGEIEAVCAKHSIPYGEPGSLDRFLRALHTDKHLAMDFWSLVARLTDRYPSANPGPLLAAIVQGVTGHPLEDLRASNPESQPLIRELTGLLAGEDVQPPLPPRPVQSARPPDLRAHVRHDAGPRKGAASSPQLTPRPDPDSDSTAPPRLVLKTDTPFAAAMALNLRERKPDPQEPQPPIAIPLAAYAEASEHSAPVSPVLLGGVLLALAAAGVLLYHSNWKRLGASIRTQYAAAVASRNQTATRSAASITGNPANRNPSATPTVLQASAVPNPDPPQPQRPSPIAAATTAPKPHDTAALTGQPHAATQVVVPQAQMRQNLISSRVPIFPAGASGPVGIQAIVTARGTVEPLRGVSGDPALARAAMAAAATWRYRPYLQNGVPVNVSTTISIDAAGN